MLVELHLLLALRIEYRDAGAAVIEQHIFKIVKDALQDRHVDVFAIVVLMTAVMIVAGFEDDVNDRTESINHVDK